MEDDRVLRVIRASAITGAGIAELVNALFELCPPAPEPPSEDDDGLVEFLVYRPRPDARGGFRILRTDRGFRVTGSAPQPDELEAALRAAGAKTGAEVEVDGETLILVTTAVLGGVFDPPHLGHVALAEGARDQLGADVLLVLVAVRPTRVWSQTRRPAATWPSSRQRSARCGSTTIGTRWTSCGRQGWITRTSFWAATSGRASRAGGSLTRFAGWRGSPSARPGFRVARGRRPCAADRAAARLLQRGRARSRQASRSTSSSHRGRTGDRAPRPLPRVAAVPGHG